MLLVPSGTLASLLPTWVYVMKGKNDNFTCFSKKGVTFDPSHIGVGCVNRNVPRKTSGSEIEEMKNGGRGGLGITA